jgi:WD40 repeat protein
METLYVFDVETGKEMQTIVTKQGIQSLAALPGSKRLVMTTIRGKRSRRKLGNGSFINQFPRKRDLQLLTLPSGEEVWKKALPEKSIGSLACSPDGNLVAVTLCRPHSQIRILEAATGKEVHTIEGVVGMFWQHPAAVSPDSTLLGCPTANSDVLIWDISRIGLR